MASLSSGFYLESKDLVRSLCCLASSNPATWVRHLTWVEYAHNTLWHSAFCISPIECQLGYTPHVSQAGGRVRCPGCGTSRGKLSQSLVEGQNGHSGRCFEGHPHCKLQKAHGTHISSQPEGLAANQRSAFASVVQEISATLYWHL